MGRETMWHEFTYVLKYCLGLDRADRNFVVFPDDIVLVSYPKSGNTWSRFLVANLIYPDVEVSFANINRLVADPALASKRFLKHLPRPRILKSHEPFDVRFPKVVYIVRDPRDVVVSEYFFSIKKRRLDPGIRLQEYVERFIAGKTGSYGSWGENVASWIATRYGNPSFLLIRYEDLLRETVHEMSRIAAFVGLESSRERLESVVSRCSADRMRRLETVQADLWSGTKNTRKEIPFVRSATSGGWKESLPAESALRIEQAWAPLLNWLGYEVGVVEPASGSPIFSKARVLPSR
jgi:hypothetical protein